MIGLVTKKTNYSKKLTLVFSQYLEKIIHSKKLILVF